MPNKSTKCIWAPPRKFSDTVLRRQQYDRSTQRNNLWFLHGTATNMFYCCLGVNNEGSAHSISFPLVHCAVLFSPIHELSVGLLHLLTQILELAYNTPLQSAKHGFLKYTYDAGVYSFYRQIFSSFSVGCCKNRKKFLRYKLKMSRYRSTAVCIDLAKSYV